MTKMKTEKIKQSLLWKDDKWAVCGRQVEVNFFFFKSLVFVAQCYKCVCAPCLKNTNLEETIISHLLLGRDWIEISELGWGKRRWAGCPCQTSWLILNKHKTSLSQLKFCVYVISVFACTYVFIFHVFN